MRRIEWKDEYDIDIGAIDEQHKALIALANAMDEAVENGQDAEIVEETIDHLIDYVAVHFASEEAFFEERHFPGLEAHKREHERLLRELLELKEDLALGLVHVAREIVDWMWRRIIPHFLEFDRRAADWIARERRRKKLHTSRDDVAA